MALIEPLMTSPALYPVVAGFAAFDVLFPVIPSEGAVIAAGVFAASAGVPNLPLVMAVAAAGAFVGDHVAYGLGRSVLGPRLIRRSKRLGKAVDAIGRQLDKRGGTMVVTSRFVPGGRTAVTLACGLTAYPLARFSRAAGLAAVLWSLYTGAIGFVGGAAFAANPDARAGRRHRPVTGHHRAGGAGPPPGRPARPTRHFRTKAGKGSAGFRGVPNRPANTCRSRMTRPPHQEAAVPTVLIADDDTDHRELMRLALRRFGHHVLEAADTREAGRLLADHRVDALLLDVRMPGESGIDFCRRLRSQPATAALPVMFVTADVNDHRILAALQAGADDYLTKPFHRSELALRLDNLLTRRNTPPARAAGAAMLATRGALHRPSAVAMGLDLKSA